MLTKKPHNLNLSLNEITHQKDFRGNISLDKELSHMNNTHTYSFKTDLSDVNNKHLNVCENNERKMYTTRDDSDIDEILNDNDEEEIEDCREFQEKFFEEMFNIISDESLTPQQEVKLLLKLYFTLQIFYKTKLKIFKNKNEELKKQLVLYYNKYAHQLKKSCVLDGKRENSYLTDIFKKQNNSIIVSDQKTRIKEFILYKFISKEEIQLGKILNINDEEKKVLIKAFLNLNNKNTNFQSKVYQKDIKKSEKFISCNNKDSSTIGFKEINLFSNQEYNEYKEDTQNNEITLKLSNKDLNDSIDIALKKQINDLSLSEILKKIPLIKISKGYYNFGTRKINLVLDNKLLKGILHLT